MTDLREESDVLVPEAQTRVSTLLVGPSEPSLVVVLAHGAGAGMHHAFLESVAAGLAARGTATFRYRFPYMERGGGRPDAPPTLTATVRAATAAAQTRFPDAALIAGGKSLGGRMTSTAAASAPLPGVRGLAFFGFPLHAPGRPARSRAEHLARVTVPMLFLQGTRDEFADLGLLREALAPLGSRATLHLIDGGDHSFKVLKRSGRTPAEVLDELLDTLDRWARGLEPPQTERLS